MTRKKSYKKKRVRILYAVIILTLVVSGAWYLFSTPGQDIRSIKVFFLKNEKLACVNRPLKDPATPLTTALEQLMAGPNLKESALGYHTAIPEGTKLLSAKKIKTTAVLNFSPQLESYGGGAAKVQALVGQIVYTATAVRGIGQVRFLINGQEQDFLGGEGYMIDKPIRREDLPADPALFLY